MNKDPACNLSEKSVRILLRKLIKKLDELDLEDYFGTEGWRHYFGLED